MYCSFMMWFIRKNWLEKIILNIFTKLIVKFLNIKENHVIERSSFRENFIKSWKYVWKILSKTFDIKFKIFMLS